MYKNIFLLFCTCCSLSAFSQPGHYTSQNIHSHNDYKQAHPFYTAYNARVGSMEADIFLDGNNLLVAHQQDELNAANTLETMYLQRLDSCIKVNNGFPYADKTEKLQLLIDLKTYGPALLDELVKHLRRFPSIINNKSITITITGIDHNFPNDSVFAAYPGFIHFDGVLDVHYSKSAQEKIVMYSDDFKKYISWRSDGALEVNFNFIKSEAARVHKAGKTFRLWDAPDNPVSWKTLMNAGVDYINTDRIGELASFLKTEN